jgi:alpha-glucosidase
VLGNHDQHRIASRIGPSQARVAQMLLLTLRGTPTCYYGDELGMRDVTILPHQVQDPFEKNLPGIGVGRDPERTPMQWSGDTYAGFSTSEPWLPVGEDYRLHNVEVESTRPDSMLTLVRRLLALRRATQALSIGAQQTFDTGSPDILAYARKHEGQRILVVLNLGSSDIALNLGNVAMEGTVLLSTHLDREGVEQLSSLPMRADEGLVLSITP